jgi:hypothetical protein
VPERLGRRGIELAGGFDVTRKIHIPQKVSRELASLRKLGAKPRTASSKSGVTGAQRSASKKPPSKEPCSDPVSFLQAVPIKQGDRPLCTVKVNKRLASSRAGAR